jgi:uncharacterized membrane protein YhaH (DUF805 family)
VTNLSAMLFSFTGRLDRAPYWLAMIATLVVGWLIIGGITLFLGFAVEPREAGLTPLVLVVPPFLGLIWISSALAIKRLHDRDKSAWWLLPFSVAPSILEAVALSVGSGGVILKLIGAGINIWGFVEIACLRGTAGPNSYGPDPLQVAGAA